MENLACISFLSQAETLTLTAYNAPREHSVIISEIVSRIAAAILLPAAAALDIAIHTLLVLPTFVYAIGKSVHLEETDFILPWQHLQRIRNAVAPLILGGVLGLLHPFAGIAVSEPTDKHSVLGMLSSNVTQNFETPCSPVHSLSIVEELARNHRYVESYGVPREVFSLEHLQIIGEIRDFEWSLEALQAQEYIHKITNITLLFMSQIVMGINASSFDPHTKEALIRLSGVFIPVLTAVDVAVALIAQAIFLATGMLRMISGRGPIYTEVTTSPLMHMAFLTQNTLKAVGNLLGTFVWFVSPMMGFRVSLLPANVFFKMQMSAFMENIKSKMVSASENSRFVLPIVFGNGECSALSVPTHSMHKTYLIVEKKNGLFNLYWVNRPNVSLKHGLSGTAAFMQIRSMLNERFPFMDIEKLMNYPVRSEEPTFSEAVNFAYIANQGNSTNCVVSNLFGMLETLDRVRGDDLEVTQLRYETVRNSLSGQYEFYRDDFSPFSNLSDGYTIPHVWEASAVPSQAAI